MAKTFDKLKKEYEVLITKIGAISTLYSGASTSRSQLQGQAFDAAAEAGKEAAKLRAAGHQGKTLADFKSEKAVADMFKYASDSQKAVSKQVDKVVKALPQFRKLDARFAEMKKELSDDIKKREKKANRKLLKISSESLPDLKKLLARMGKDETKMLDDLRENLDDAQAELSEPFIDRFEMLFLEQLGKTKAQREETELFGKALTNAVNHRTQLMYQRQARALHSEVKKFCSEALQAAKDGNSPKASLDEAAKRYKAMHKIAKMQTKSREVLVKHVKEAKRRKDAKGEKAAKESLVMIDTTLAIDADMKGLLQKVTAATFKLQRAS